MCSAPANTDAAWMEQALALAREGLGRTSPNPAVGAVVVKDNVVLGKGYHKKYGEAHAEVNALEDAGELAEGATVYVTLEPCSHEGKTPPCTKALIDAKVARVVFGVRDPNDEAKGGAEVLQAAGIETSTGELPKELEDEMQDFYAYYYKHIKVARPFVIAKWAMTLDGRIASRTGDSKWITSEKARAHARILRAESDAVIVGVGTLLRDDPKLTARAKDGREPLRVIVDSGLRTPPESEIFSVAGSRVIMACRPDAEPERAAALTARGAEIMHVAASGKRVNFEALLHSLYERGLLRIFIEGGATLHGAVFDSGCVDEVYAFIAPKIIGGKSAPPAIHGRGIPLMKRAYELENVRTESIGPDILMRGRLGKWDWM